MAPGGAGQVGLYIADSEADLAADLARAGDRKYKYAVIIDRPGDKGALVRAIATNVKAQYTGAPLTADQMTSGATGWLYEILPPQGGLESSQKRFRDYIRPALYAA